jgi:hypothetical protein
MKEMPNPQWEHLIAAAVIAPIIWMAGVILTSGFAIFGYAYLAIILTEVLFWGGIFLPIPILLFPVAMYFDLKKIKGADTKWNPNLILYVILSISGLFIPFLIQIVGSIYLYNRRKFATSSVESTAV